MNNKFCILIAEDNLVNQKVIRIILERGGFKYEIAQDGAEAFEMYQNGKYDLVLMDCQMPNLNGLETTIKIRELELSRNLPRCPIVAMTANAMSGDQDRCMTAGMDGFLSKPFKSHDLIQTIQQWGAKQ